MESNISINYTSEDDVINLFNQTFFVPVEKNDYKIIQDSNNIHNILDALLADNISINLKSLIFRSDIYAGFNDSEFIACHNLYCL